MSDSTVQCSDSVDIAVIGAGPAGLAAAWYAARRGLTVRVLDRADRVGGLAASITVDGQRVDLGSHRLHPSIRGDLLDDLRGLLGDELQLRPRNGRIRLDGRWVAFPLRPADLARNARPSFAARVLADIASAPLRRRRADAPDFASRVRDGMGRAIAAAFYEPYAVKLWGVPANDLSGELFRRRVGARSAARVLGAALRRGDPPSFWYPAGGFGRIAEAMAATVTADGGTIELGAELQQIVPAAGEVVLRRGSGPPLRARTVVSTIPGRDLAALASAPADVRAAANTLHHRGCVLVYLSVPRPRYTAFDAHYFPEQSVRVSRLSEPKSYRDSMADPADRSVLCAEIPATVGDDAWRTPDADLAEVVRSDLLAMGLPDPSPRAVHVERRSHVYPVYLIGFERAQQQLDTWVESVDGLVSLGRQALFAHDNTHHALAMGHAVAECLDRHGAVDRSAWRAARAAFADHVVED
jgi:protoporphyrinogen oxidase